MPIDPIIRRMVAGLIAQVLLVQGLAAQTPSPPSPRGVPQDPCDWPFFLGFTGDSKSTETGIRINWSSGRLPIRWTRELGESYGIGAVSQDRYYQFDRNGDLAQLLCLDADTGTEHLGEHGDLMLLRANPGRFEQVSMIQPRGEHGQPLLRYPCWADPILAHGRLYVRGRDRVVCFELVPQRDKAVGASSPE